MRIEELYAYKELTAVHYELLRKIEKGNGDDEIKRKLSEVKKRLGKISDFILGCTDPLIKELMILRFTRFLGWEQVAMKIGGYNSGDGCRMLVTRYLDRANRKRQY